MTTRLWVDDYRLLKSYASLSGESVNEVVVQAVREFLEEHATEEAMAAMVEEHRASLRTARSTH